ncbi:MAG: class I SAM-dependent methyltransferase [Spirochaetes bacterium]|nr:class I SAM-dependent methyltransferase [Spirochaetota bacterium]
MNRDIVLKSQDYYARARSEMAVFIPGHCGTILDVGCGEGNFGRVVKERLPNVQIHGIEKNSGAALRARKNLDKVINQDIDRAIPKLSDAFYDCIVFNDLLEHLADPIDILIKIRPKMKKDGIILSSIPNVRFLPVVTDLLIHKNWTYGSEGILDYTHLRFFTEKSIVSLFESAGYTVSSVTGINKTNFSWRFRLVNFLCRGMFSDMAFMQFACVARKK